MHLFQNQNTSDVVIDHSHCHTPFQLSDLNSCPLAHDQPFQEMLQKVCKSIQKLCVLGFSATGHSH